VVNGCGGGDCAWTLWVLNGAQKQWPHQDWDRKEQKPKTERDEKQEQQTPPPPAEESEESSESAVGTGAEIVRDQPHTCSSDPMDRREPIVADDDDSVVVDLIGMLRNCLCDISNDRGDVLCGAAAMRTEHDNAADVDAAAADAASQTGPLGDA